MVNEMYTLWINPHEKKGKINKEIYGHFSEHLGRCIYEGLYVGEDSEIANVNGMRKDVVEALKAMKIPVLRWPGGCFADEYHWKDGIGPKENRKRMVNTHWGGVVEDNSFGTHEFFELCRQLECEPYINGNVGSGTVQEMNEWIEYMTFDGVSPMADLRAKNGQEKPWKVKYFGVGNENWGCGGNMTAEHYASEFRRYATYCRNYGDNKLYKIACGFEHDPQWNETVMKIAGRFLDGLSIHYYTIPGTWEDKGSATEFDEDIWYLTLKKALHMDKLITLTDNIMSRYDPDKKKGIIVDEWGTWFNVEPGTNPGFLYQQNTMRDALVAGITFDIFNKHCDRVKMANIAQLVNVLQAVILTEGAKMILTPTYHVFKMYSKHQEAQLVHSYMKTELIGTDKDKVPNMSHSVSEDAEGNITITINNLSVQDSYDVQCRIADRNVTKIEGEILTEDFRSYNTFEEPDKVMSKAYSDYEINNGVLTLHVPPCSVLSITIPA